MLLLVAVATAGADGFAAEISAARQSESWLSPSGVFNSIEARAGARDRHPQWARVLKIMASRRAGLRDCMADISKCANPEEEKWHRLLASAAGLDRRSTLETVNRFFNRWPYRKDRRAYGVVEHWASPDEFLVRSGDCEDFAIAKFFALRQLGFADDDLRIVVLYDWLRRIPHAVLAVRVDGDILILDNVTNHILSHTRIRYYEPRTSMNESGKWRHRKPPLQRAGRN